MSLSAPEARAAGSLAAVAARPALVAGLGLDACQTGETRNAVLVFDHRPSDEIYIFGFSWGAHTARSFAGLIRSVGILDRVNIHKFAEAIARYRRHGELGHPDAPDNCAFRWKTLLPLQRGRRKLNGAAGIIQKGLKVFPCKSLTWGFGTPSVRWQSIPSALAGALVACYETATT